MKLARRGLSRASAIGVGVVILILVGVGIFYATQTPAAPASTSTTSTGTSSFASSSTTSSAPSSTVSSSSTTSSTTSSSATDQALYQAAQQEGQLVVYGSVDKDQFGVMTDAFAKVFPGITVQYTNFSPSQLYTRISSEISASGHTADLVITDGLVLQLQAGGFVITYVAPAAASFPKQSLDPTNSSTPILLLPQTMVYNTKMLTPSQLPQDLTGLSNSQWSGKIVMHDPTLGTGGTHYWAAQSTTLGNDTVNNFLRALKANVNPTLIPSPSSTESNVANGQYAIGVEVFLTDVVGDINANSPVAPLTLQGVPVVVIVSDATILKGAQHLNAAKLLIDYLASPAGQTVIGNVTNQLPQSSIRIPVNPNVQTVYSLSSLLAKYQPGAKVIYMPNSVLASAANAAYKATYTSIFKP